MQVLALDTGLAYTETVKVRGHRLATGSISHKSSIYIIGRKGSTFIESLM